MVVWRCAGKKRRGPVWSCVAGVGASFVGGAPISGGPEQEARLFIDMRSGTIQIDNKQVELELQITHSSLLLGPSLNQVEMQWCVTESLLTT